MILFPGVVVHQNLLATAEQQHLWEVCRTLAEGPVPMYTPTVRGGKKMSVRMLCLGKHWNAQTYSYEDKRSDFDNLRVPEIPGELAAIAANAAKQSGFSMSPDLCIMNFYDADSRMGVHQDKDEGEDSIRAGIPIVSVSIGDTARFVIGGLSRKEPTSAILLRSGDVLVMGGPSRLRFHGVTRILPGTAPEGTGPGRFNLTFRQY
jgi:DNA alkylation damage repair protein AlkB